MTQDAVRLTTQDRLVLATIAKCGCEVPGVIAREAGIHTHSPRETAARHCIKLTKLGLAQKAGTAMGPEWQITDLGRRALANGTGER